MSLVAFAKQFDRIQIGDFVNKDSGECFKSVIFSKGDNMTFVAFSTNLGALTSRELAAQKDNLQVVQLESGNYRICKQGGNAWEDVDLGL